MFCDINDAPPSNTTGPGEESVGGDLGGASVTTPIRPETDTSDTNQKENDVDTADATSGSTYRFDWDMHLKLCVCFWIGLIVARM